MEFWGANNDLVRWVLAQFLPYNEPSEREREFPNIPLNKNPDWASVQN